VTTTTDIVLRLAWHRLTPHPEPCPVCRTRFVLRDGRVGCVHLGVT
jgi:hypothetical protein